MSAVAGPSHRRSTVASQSAADTELYRTVARLSAYDLDGIAGALAAIRSPGVPVTDAELAVRLAREEAEAFQIFNSDRALAQQLQTTWHPLAPNRQLDEITGIGATPGVTGTRIRDPVAAPRATDPLQNGRTQQLIAR